MRSVGLPLVAASAAKLLGEDTSAQSTRACEVLLWPMDLLADRHKIVPVRGGRVVSQMLHRVVKGSSNEVDARSRLAAFANTTLEATCMANSPFLGEAMKRGRSIIEMLGATKSEEELSPAISKLQPDEMPVSVHGLGTYFVGHAPTLVKQLLSRTHLPVDAQHAPLHDAPSRMKITMEGMDIMFTHRMHASNRVWSVPVSQLDDLGRAMHWKRHPSFPIPEIRQDEMAVSKIAVQPHFIGYPYAVVRKILKVTNLSVDARHAPLPGSPRSMTIPVGDKSFTFAQRMNKGEYVWAIARDQLDDFSKAAGLKRRPSFSVPELSPHEMAISDNGVRPYFVGSWYLVPKQILETACLPVDARSSPLATAPLTMDVLIEGTPFTFAQRTHHRLRIWAIEKTKLPLLAEVMHKKLRVDLP